jgi:hypothetical protein
MYSYGYSKISDLFYADGSAFQGVIETFKQIESFTQRDRLGSSVKVT